MAEATVNSKVVDSLLLIYCLMHFPLFVGNLCLSLFCYVLLCVHSIFCNHLEEEEKAGCFAFIVLQMSCYCKCLWLFLTVSWPPEIVKIQIIYIPLQGMLLQVI